MSKLSVIVPSRNELFLPQTVNDLLTKASGEIEVIAVLDGYWPQERENFDFELWLSLIENKKNLIVLHRGTPYGMRSAINSAVAIASGEYLMKCDAHCMFAEGYDEVLKADCDDNWIVIPARYSLDAENWAIEKNKKLRRDYHYLCYPDPNKNHDHGMHGVEWWDRCRERADNSEYDIDDTMSMQGSCWFMTKKHFDNFLGGMSEVGYGTFSQEPQEIGLKTVLGGGELKTNKKTWYAHLHKGKRYGRGYNQRKKEIVIAHDWAAHYWMTNSWEGRVHDLEWFIEKFYPVPTWGEDWQNKFDEWRKHNNV